MKKILITTFAKQILIISIMNENLDLVEILKDCPKGTKLYSPIFGEVEFEEAYNDAIYPIVVKMKTNPIEGECTEEIRSFSSSGMIDLSFNGECMLFPSKDQRDWSKFKPKKAKFDPNTLNPFDKVLARLDDQGIWYCEWFSFIQKDTNLIKCCGAYYKYCIPYNDETKYLVGTFNEAPEFYRFLED